MSAVAPYHGMEEPLDNLMVKMIVERKAEMMENRRHDVMVERRVARMAARMVSTLVAMTPALKGEQMDEMMVVELLVEETDVLMGEPMAVLRVEKTADSKVGWMVAPKAELTVASVGMTAVSKADQMEVMMVEPTAVSKVELMAVQLDARLAICTRSSHAQQKKDMKCILRLRWWSKYRQGKYNTNRSAPREVCNTRLVRMSKTSFQLLLHTAQQGSNH